MMFEYLPRPNYRVSNPDYGRDGGSPLYADSVFAKHGKPNSILRQEGVDRIFQQGYTAIRDGELWADRVHFVDGKHWMPPAEVCKAWATKSWEIELEVDGSKLEGETPPEFDGKHSFTVAAGTSRTKMTGGDAWIAPDPWSPDRDVSRNAPGWETVRDAVRSKRHPRPSPNEDELAYVPEGYAELHCGWAVYDVSDPPPLEKTLSGGLLSLDVYVRSWKPAYYIADGRTTGTWPEREGLTEVWFFDIVATAWMTNYFVWQPSGQQGTSEVVEEVGRSELALYGDGKIEIGIADSNDDSGDSDAALKVTVVEEAMQTEL